VPAVVVASLGDMKKVVVVGSNKVIIAKPHVQSISSAANHVSKALNNATVPEARKVVEVTTVGGKTLGIVIEETADERLVYISEKDALERFKKSATPVVKVSEQEIIKVNTKGGKVLPGVVVGTNPANGMKKVVIVGIGRIIEVKPRGLAIGHKKTSDQEKAYEESVKDALADSSHSFARPTGEKKRLGLKTGIQPKTTQGGHRQLADGIRQMTTDPSGLFGMGNVFMPPSTAEGDTMSVTEKAGNAHWGSVMPFAENERRIWGKLRTKPQANEGLAPAYHAWHSHGMYVNYPAFDYPRSRDPELAVGDIYLAE